MQQPTVPFPVIPKAQYCAHALIICYVCKIDQTDGCYNTSLHYSVPCIVKHSCRFPGVRGCPWKPWPEPQDNVHVVIQYFECAWWLTLLGARISHGRWTSTSFRLLWKSVYKISERLQIKSRALRYSKPLTCQTFMILIYDLWYCKVFLYSGTRCNTLYNAYWHVMLWWLRSSQKFAIVKLL